MNNVLKTILFLGLAAVLLFMPMTAAADENFQDPPSVVLAASSAISLNSRGTGRVPGSWDVCCRNRSTSDLFARVRGASRESCGKRRTIHASFFLLAPLLASVPFPDSHSCHSLCRKSRWRRPHIFTSGKELCPMSETGKRWSDLYRQAILNQTRTGCMPALKRQAAQFKAVPENCGTSALPKPGRGAIWIELSLLDAAQDSWRRGRSPSTRALASSRRSAVPESFGSRLCRSVVVCEAFETANYS